MSIGTTSPISNDYDTYDTDNSDYDSDSNVKPTRKASKRKEQQSVTKNKWTSEEDEIVKDKYAIYAGSRSVYEMIALDDLLVSRGHSATDVENRVKKLSTKGQLVMFSEVSTSSSSSTNLPSEKDTPMDSFKLHSSQIRVLNEIGGKGTPLYRSPMELMSIKQSNSVKKTNKTLSSRSFDQFSADTGSMFPFSHNSAYRARRAAHSQQH